LDAKDIIIMVSVREKDRWLAEEIIQKYRNTEAALVLRTTHYWYIHNIYVGTHRGSGE
jgi:hypothetical protein